MALVERLIETSVELVANPPTNQPGTFAGTDGRNTTTISGARASARIQNSGSPGGSTATLRVWGLTQSLMNQLSTLGIAFNVIPRNKIVISAGDAGAGLTTVFAGIIFQGYADYNAAPEVPFVFECQAGLSDLVAPTQASSFRGATDVATIMSGFARAMGLGFENNGVTAQLSNPYFAGNVWVQMRECAAHANINAEVINGNLLAIWPKGGNRATPNVPTVAPHPEGGMIGYPTYTPQGIIVRNVYDPLIAFGGLFKVKTSLKPVADVGQWAVYKIDHALDSLMPGGLWESSIYAFNPKYPKPVIK